jgi:hypothetical protein
MIAKVEGPPPSGVTASALTGPGMAGQGAELGAVEDRHDAYAALAGQPPFLAQDFRCQVRAGTVLPQRKPASISRSHKPRANSSPSRRA